MKVFTYYSAVELHAVIMIIIIIVIAIGVIIIVVVVIIIIAIPDADNDPLCPKPTAPANGYITGHNYDDGGVVHIHCLAGYTLSGPSNLTCIPVPHPDAPGIWLPQDEYKCLRE